MLKLNKKNSFKEFMTFKLFSYKIFVYINIIKKLYNTVLSCKYCQTLNEISIIVLLLLLDFTIFLLYFLYTLVIILRYILYVFWVTIFFNFWVNPWYKYIALIIWYLIFHQIALWIISLAILILNLNFLILI